MRYARGRARSADLDAAAHDASSADGGGDARVDDASAAVPDAHVPARDAVFVWPVDAWVAANDAYYMHFDLPTEYRWVAATATERTPEHEARIRAPSTNVRAAPSVESAVVGSRSLVDRIGPEGRNGAPGAPWTPRGRAHPAARCREAMSQGPTTPRISVFGSDRHVPCCDWCTAQGRAKETS